MGVAMGVDAFHAGKQFFVGSLSCAGLAGACRVVAAGRDFQSLAEFGDGKVGPKRIDQRIALGGSSESMLMAFFRISR